MKATSRPVLGVAFDERSAVVAEVRLARGEWRVERVAEFPFPEGASWQDPASVGKAFGQFLRERHFTSRRAVLGLPANWLMAREVNVPPATGATITDIVRLQAEREFSPDMAEVVLDYADAGDARQARPVLLVGALRERLNQVTALAAAARLTVLSVTSEALAVSAAFQRLPSSCGITVVLRPQGTDLVAHAGSQFCAVRHVPISAPDPLNAAATLDARIAPLLSEVRRALATLAGNQTPEQETELTLWDGIGLSPDTISGMTAELGMEVRVKNKLTEVGSRSPQAGEESASVRFVPATALAIAGLNGARPPIDLVHSRFAPPAKKILGRRVVWASAAAAVALAAIAAAVVTWQKEQSAVALLTQQVADMKTEVDSAEDLVGKVAFARTWYEDRPKVLDCLRGMTAAFPANGRAWVTRLSVKEPAPDTRAVGLAQAGPAGTRAAKPGPGVVRGPLHAKASLTGVLIGKCADDRAPLETLDRLKKAKGFFDVNEPQRSKPAGRNTGVENSFSLNFNFTSAE